MTTYFRLALKAARVFGVRSYRVESLRSHVDKRRREFSDSDVFLASYPRSGNTWMRRLLADVVLQIHGYDTRTDLPVCFKRVVPEVNPGVELTLHPGIRMPHRVMKTHSFYTPVMKSVVVLYRLPCASLTSFFHFSTRQAAWQHIAKQGSDPFCRSMVSDWQRHSKSYIRAIEQGRVNALPASYEELAASPAEVLHRVCRWLKLDVQMSNCRRAVENQEFRKLQEWERNNKTPKRSKFFRTGMVDGFEQELSQATIDFIGQRANPIYERLEELKQETGTAVQSGSASP